MRSPSTTYFSLAESANLPTFVRHVDTKLGVLREALDSTLIAKELALIIDRRDLTGAPRAKNMIEEAKRNATKRQRTEGEHKHNACEISFYEDAKTQRLHGTITAHQMRWYRAIILMLPGVEEVCYEATAKGREDTRRLILKVTLGEKDLSESYLLAEGMVPLLSKHIPSRGHRALDHTIDRAGHILHAKVCETYPHYRLEDALVYAESHPPYALASLIGRELVSLTGNDLDGTVIGPTYSKTYLLHFQNQENAILTAWLDDALRETLLKLAV